MIGDPIIQQWSTRGGTRGFKQGRQERSHVLRYADPACYTTSQKFGPGPTLLDPFLGLHAREQIVIFPKLIDPRDENLGSE
jgi:hypothetical protein